MSENQATIKPGSTNWLWREVSEEIAETLTPTQKEAIEAAISRSTADSQPADLRFTIGDYFIRIMAGKERRSRDRVKKEQQENPVFQKKNTPVIVAYWVVMLLASLYFFAFTINILSFLGFMF